MGYRRRGRERALQCLYQWEATATPVDTLLERFWRSQPEPEQVRAFAERLVRGAVASAGAIDRLIVEQAANWRLERMGSVDRSILRLGVYELLYERETPPAVVIDEAIELAKRFSGEEAGAFVNGILDGIRRRAVAGAGAEAGDGRDKSEAHSG